MNFEFVQHKKCSENIFIEISRLKDEFWHYPIEEHLRWMEKNLDSDDIHLLLRNEKNDLIGYLNLVNLSCQAENVSISCIGIGNVCVKREYQQQSIGYLLVKLTEYHLLKNKKTGVLLCKDSLAAFYNKCKWIQYSGNKFSASGDRLTCNLFATKHIESPSFIIDRNF